MVFGWWLLTPPEEPPEISPEAKQLRVHFINVGQGDSTLIQTPDGRIILVDAGDSNSGEQVVDYLRRLGISRIDLLVISHPHEDHIGGLVSVIDNLGVSCVVDRGWEFASPIYEQVLTRIKERRIDYRCVDKDSLPVLSKDTQIEFLCPWPVHSGGSESAVNNGSIVVVVRYKQVSFLLTGDIQLEAEAQLLGKYRDLQTTVLKVAHHGSSDSTSNELLQVTKPAYAVISVGAGNPYGHPSRVILRRLRAAGTKVYRTDVNGNIIFSTDGEVVKVDTEK